MSKYLLLRNVQGQLSSFLRPRTTIGTVGVDVVFDYNHTANVQITPLRLVYSLPIRWQQWRASTEHKCAQRVLGTV